ALVALRSRLLRLGGAPEEAWNLRDEVDSPALLVETVAAALATGRIDHARKLLVGTPWTGSEPRPTVERHVQAAWLASAEGFSEDAVRSLRQAMETASVHSLVEVFVRAGPVVVRLVAEHDDVAPDFRNAILARARDIIAPVTGGDLPDPLTDRELEILSYLPSRLTNTELAEKCYVSVNTIKTHMAHIYRKLDVANRNEAIIRARQFGLL
ncbi:MAG TPA: LuxR C-terminal-related transcriptional regulator, partial [Acidimicrobiales bacterium]|nr:LuxR C-terminal-related transcriptional regulator [Acidimicrobiales bacterium]